MMFSHGTLFTFLGYVMVVQSKIYLLNTRGGKNIQAVGKDYLDEYKEVEMEVGEDYSEDGPKRSYASDEKSTKRCGTIEGHGPGGGKPCVFPFIYRGKTYHECTKDGSDDDVNEFWCSTEVDEEGVTVANTWAACNEHCPGMDGHDSGYFNKSCQAARQEEWCDIPFTHQGFTYHGCIQHEKAFWCKKLGGSILTRCSASCPHDVILSKKRLSKKQLVKKIKKNPSVYTKIDFDENCTDLFPQKEWEKICLSANYCRGKDSKNECGVFHIYERFTHDFTPAKKDCHLRCSYPGMSNNQNSK